MTKDSFLVQLLDLLQVQQALLAPARLPLWDLRPELRVQVVCFVAQLVSILVRLRKALFMQQCATLGTTMRQAQQ